MTDKEYNRLVELRNKCYQDRRDRETEINYFTGFNDGYEKGREPLEKENAELRTRVRELEQQIEKLIDFVLSKTECCDVCPITDTCINSEGTCPYAGILAKGEEEVTREWLMQFISREIKEND